MKVNLFFAMAGTGLGLLAGIMAYIITYNEYEHHFGSRKVHRESMKSALIAFVFFVTLSILPGVFSQQAMIYAAKDYPVNFNRC